MSQFNVYHEGKVHVCKTMCKTCIFRPGNLFHLEPGRLEQMVDGAVAEDTTEAFFLKVFTALDCEVCR